MKVLKIFTILFLVTSLLGLKSAEANNVLKNKILKKIEVIENQKKQLNFKLLNKAYLKNAPKEVVQNDKDLLKDLTIEDSKLRSIVSSIN